MGRAPLRGAEPLGPSPSLPLEAGPQGGCFSPNGSIHPPCSAWGRTAATSQHGRPASTHSPGLISCPAALNYSRHAIQRALQHPNGHPWVHDGSGLVGRRLLGLCRDTLLILMLGDAQPGLPGIGSSSPLPAPGAWLSCPWS